MLLFNGMYDANISIFSSHCVFCIGELLDIRVLISRWAALVDISSAAIQQNIE